MRPQFPLRLLLALSFASIALADEWKTLGNCRLIENESNDGDSFHVKADGEEHIFRLYFVDTPEAEEGGYVEKRVTEQAETFGITEEASVAMGKKAAAFTRDVLSRPFKVLTRGQRALGASRIQREYAFVTTADGDDLGEALVSRGLARSFGETASGPRGSADSLRSKYDRLERSARSQRLGAWGKDSTAATLALPEKETTKDESPAPDPPPDPIDSLGDRIASSAQADAERMAASFRFVEPGGVTPAKADVEPQQTKTAPPQAASGGKISLNTAGLKELESLPEIGPKAAAAIIAGRPYKSVTDVLNVAGIGPKTFQAIAPLVRE